MESILQLTSDHVTHLLEFRLPKGITYHNLTHTKEVVDTAKTIGEKSEVNSDQMEMVLLAAWFHDVGINEQYNEHEEKSAELCREFLMEHNYPADKIKKIGNIIRATRIPQNPTNLLEDIICDADISYIGNTGFFSRSQLLRKEWENILGRNFSNDDWLKINIDFLLENKFHTKCAKSLYDEQRKKNLASLQKKLKSYKITPPPKHKSLS